MVELKGSLSSIGLPAIVQLIGELHHSGNLELSRGTSTGVLGFDDGHLVAARLDDKRGLTALIACILDLADADFVFVEGQPVGERTMDLWGGELQKYLARLMSGEVTAETLEPVAVKADETESLGICPMLGFVDDPSRHYSRATALHRCFSGGSPSLITGPEQRELCLSGRYPTCPRFRNAPASKTVAAAPMPIADLPTRPPGPPPAVSTPTPVVAAQVSAAGQMRAARPPSADPETVPALVGPQEAQPPPSGSARKFRVGFRPRRGLVLVAIGAALGLVVLVVGLLVVLPTLNGGAVRKPSNVLAQPGEPASPVPTPSAATIVIARPTVAAPPVAAAIGPTPQPAPSVLPAASAPPRPTAAPAASAASPTARSQPAAPAIAAPGQTLTDVRFASGAKPGWLENPPYATWNDGAYRLQARMAARFVAISAPIEQQLTDVVVSATFRKTGGPPGGGYGIVVRNQSPDPLNGVNQEASAYVLEAGDLGEFGVWRRDGDHWVDLVPWTRSTAVRVGGSPNDLVVRAIGDRLIFQVNAVEVASVQDDVLRAGGVGVFVGGDYNEVALDRFTAEVPN